jgi:hypothetical protein
VRDWLRWYEGYDDPTSALARRLEVVKRSLTEALDGAASTVPTILGAVTSSVQPAHLLR